MTFKQLQYFMAVARTLSFTEAAKSQFVSQPALSRSIAELENELDLTLFHRNHHSVSLTPAGTLLAAELPKLKMEFERLIIMVRQTDDGLMGRLNVGMLDGQKMDEALLVSFEYFRQSLPLVELCPRCLNQDELESELESDRLDIIFTINFGLSERQDLDYLELDTLQYCIALPERHPLSRRNSATLADFAKDTFIVIEGSGSACTKFLLDGCAQAGFTPQIKSVPDTRTQLLWVESGFGIALLNTKNTAFTTTGLRAVPLNGLPTSRLILAWKKDTKNPCVRLFVHLTECCQ